MEVSYVNNLALLLHFMFCLKLALGILNIEEIHSVNYAVNILQKPVLSGQSASVSVMYLRSRYGQQYQCLLPDLDFTSEEWRLSDDTSSPKANIAHLLTPLQLGPCLLKVKDWWTYEFCYNKIIRQYHLEENKVVSPEIILGHYESEFDWKNDSWQDKSRNRLQRYHSQYYVNGTQCDVTGSLRRAEVRFVCEEGAGNYVARVDEPESCRYILTVHTSHVCHHPYLKPSPSNKLQSLTCNPVLSADQYEEYLFREEETMKTVKEQNSVWLAQQEEHLEQMREQTSKQTEEESKLDDDDAQKDLLEEIMEEEIQTEKEINTELEEENDEDTNLVDEDRHDALTQLTSTLNRILKKLNEAEEDISQTTKTLAKVQQKFEPQSSAGQTDAAETSKAKTPFRQEGSNDPKHRLSAKDLVKVRVSYANGKQQSNEKDDPDERQRQSIEDTIRQKLEHSGLDTGGRKIEVKLVKYIASDSEEEFHVLSEEESSQLKNLLVAFFAGNQDVIDELEKQQQLEENYRFVWETKNKQMPRDNDD